MPNPEGAVTKLKHVAILLASCVLIGGFTTDGSAQYQSWDRDWRERDRDDRDRGWRGRGGAVATRPSTVSPHPGASLRPSPSRGG